MGGTAGCRYCGWDMLVDGVLKVWGAKGIAGVGCGVGYWCCMAQILRGGVL